MAMRTVLWISATYFFLALLALAVSMLDLPPALYAFAVLILPLIWLGRLLEPVLSVLGLWSKVSGGWVSYEGPNFGGLLLIAIMGLAVTALLLLLLLANGKGD